uniref:ATP synthase subunit a n=1 Tax=Ectopleura larynx TaxID=264052 RepID=G9ISH5_9CNID|nr:ATP synthase F0 subunit 6 [Ectopleura larynx]
MSSYFDHFIIVKFFNIFFSDSLVIMVSTIILYVLIFKSSTLVPSDYQFIFNKIYNHWSSVVIENLGREYKFFIFPLLTLFSFILGVNLLGFFLFTLPTTTHISITFGIALSLWLGVVIFGVYKFGLSYFSIFMPSGAPIGLAPLLIIIELASHISRPIALGMRLAANLTAGHILLSILGDFSIKLLLISPSLPSFFPILIIIFMVVLEIGVLIIQAYVFTLLLLIYLKDSLILH